MEISSRREFVKAAGVSGVAGSALITACAPAERSVDYETAVRETWRHSDLTRGAQNYWELVRYATLAASSHNTQPWKFRLEEQRISILPDLSRRCPAVDPDDHHLFVSLGCAAENLLLAAQASGLGGHLTSDASAGRDGVVRVALEKTPPSVSPLFEAIPRRQCSRAGYDGRPVASEQLKLLEGAGHGAGVSVLLLTDERRIEKVAEYVAEGNAAQIADRKWLDELEAWIRFNQNEAVRTRDGLYAAASGNPEAPRWMGKLFMRFALSAKRQNEKDVNNIRSAAGIAVFISEADDKAHWIEAGRCYERFALRATSLGLRNAFVNQPVEVPALRPQFASWLGIGQRRPDVVVRFGYGPEMPRSLRRPVEQVIL